MVRARPVNSVQSDSLVAASSNGVEQAFRPALTPKNTSASATEVTHRMH